MVTELRSDKVLTVARFAAAFSPPQLMIEYTIPAADSLRLKIIKLRHFKTKTLEQLKSALCAQYPHFFRSSQIPPHQVESVLQALLDAAHEKQQQKKKNKNKKLSTNQEGGATGSTLSSGASGTGNSAGPGSAARAAAPAAATVKFGPGSIGAVSEPVLTKEEDLLAIDLNKCSDELNLKAKQLMDQRFEKTRLKPGDEGFVWDKQVEFEAPTEAADWDDSEEEDD